MHLFRETFLLFTLNLLDAILTLLWVRSGSATEANHLMATLLDMGDYPFFSSKLAMGTITAVVILKLRLLKRYAKPLVSFALVLYIGLMGVHVLTGLPHSVTFRRTFWKMPRYGPERSSHSLSDPQSKHPFASSRNSINNAVFFSPHHSLALLYFHTR
jgi:hypothetical protein